MAYERLDNSRYNDIGHGRPAVLPVPGFGQMDILDSIIREYRQEPEPPHLEITETVYLRGFAANRNYFTALVGRKSLPRGPHKKRKA